MVWLQALHTGRMIHGTDAAKTVPNLRSHEGTVDWTDGDGTYPERVVRLMLSARSAGKIQELL
jgi:hypothetical protein